MWFRQQSRGQEAQAGPSQGNYPCGFLSPAGPQFPSSWPHLLLKQTPVVWASGSQRGAGVLDRPSAAVLTQRTQAGLQNLYLNTFPGGMAAGGCGLLLKVLDSQGQSLRVWGPGDGESGFGSWGPLPMAVTVYQVRRSPEPRLEGHSSLCYSPLIATWDHGLSCPS